MKYLSLLLLLGLSLLGQSRRIDLWHGDVYRVGHLGDAQDDVIIAGHVRGWEELDQLLYTVNGSPAWTPLSYRAHRRLVEDGDFNLDLPVGSLRMGENLVSIEASFRDGTRLEREFRVLRETGKEQALPLAVRWQQVKRLEDAGQVVDGHWEITPEGLRTKQVGYDRLFLIGNRSWQDYEVRTEVKIHRVMPKTTRISGGNGIGLILRFAGHVAGGHRHFGSGQPKWGYQPFGSIGWIRWNRGEGDKKPFAQYYPGDSDRSENNGEFPVEEGATYGVRFACETLPDAANGEGVTRYRFKAWKLGEAEPAAWTWERVQSSRHALRRGGVALLAHHIDATFGDVFVEPIVRRR